MASETTGEVCEACGSTVRVENRLYYYDGGRAAPMCFTCFTTVPSYELPGMVIARLRAAQSGTELATRADVASAKADAFAGEWGEWQQRVAAYLANTVRAVQGDMPDSEDYAIRIGGTWPRLSSVRWDGKSPSIENALLAAHAKSSRQRIDTCHFCGDKQSRGRHVVACGCRGQMVDTIIARQVEQGGVDTEGTRHEAERWCAMVCGCVCEGMRATTWRSRYRETGGDYEGAVTAEIIDGHLAEPLGRP